MGSVITIAGEKLFAAKAQANQQLDIDTFIFANVPGQDPTAPIDREEPLPPQAQIVHQQVVQQVGRINENVVVYSTVLDSVTGPFEFNWVGLYSSVNQTLVAINHVPTVAKTVTGPGVAGNTLNRNFGIEYSGIADLTGITVAPETWQLDFTARLSGMDELTRQLAADMNGKDWFIGDGFKVVPRATANSFSVTPGVGYVSGLRIELEQEHIINVQTYPQFVYVDAWFAGDANSMWKPKIAFTVSDTEMDDYIDVQGVQHYVYKLASLNAGDNYKDLRVNGSLSERINTAIKYTTTSELLTGKFDKGGEIVAVTDRDYKLFKITIGGIPDGTEVLDAGGGNTAVYVFDKSISARAVGLKDDGTSQNSVMNKIAAIIAGNPYISINFESGVYIMSKVQFSGLSNFSLNFNGRVVFKLDDKAEGFAFRLGNCSEFRTSGTLYYDGNKLENESAGSGAGAGNGTISFSGGCSRFYVEAIDGVNGWTNGVAFDNCSNFEVKKISSNNTARRGVTIYNCSDFEIDEIKGDGSDLSNIVYVIGSRFFFISKIKAKNSGGSNAVLFEIGCKDFSVGKILTNNSYSGIKFEKCERFEANTLHSDGTFYSHGVTINSCKDWQIDKVKSWNSAASGLAILNAEGDCWRGYLGSVNVGINNNDGVIVFTENEFTFEHIEIGHLVSASNNGHGINVSGAGDNPNLPFSGTVKINRISISGLASGMFGVFSKVTSDPNKGGVTVSKGRYTTNQPNTIPFADGDSTPSIATVVDFSKLAKTQNTAETVIYRFDNFSGGDYFKLLIDDDFTSFANGSGDGGVIIEGETQVAKKGSLWECQYINQKWYTSRVLG